MAKPSVANIKAPAPTFTVPSKTVWDLNEAADITAAGGDYILNSGSTVAAFNDKTATINTSEPSGVLNQSEFHDYDYVFFGVNGGVDETVKGTTGLAGIIVTGNGMDNITGGNEADLILAGNGKDVINAGGGNDIVFGENGADTINGGADTGTASYVAPDDGQIINPGNIFIWDEDPTGTSVAGETSDNTVRKEGVFIDDDGVIHTVFSYSPDEAGVHTIGYYKNGTTLDGPGDPSPDYFATGDLVVGQKYYYSFVGDGDTVHVNVFVGDITPPEGPPGQWPVKSVATSQAMPTNYDITIIDGGNGTFNFEAGDQLIGGNGPDQFVWDAADTNNVDLIWDYNQGDGTYNPLEGDTLLLIGVTDYTTFMKDLDGDNVEDLVIYVGENQAIGLVGITDINQVTFG